jgi:hypothetical protein
LTKSKKLFEVKINNDTVAFGDIGLRLCHRLMRRTLRPEAVAVLGERRVPSLLQNLQQRLLDQSIDDTGDAEFSDTAVGFRYLYPPDWLRPVGSAEQLRPDIWPMLTQVTLGIFDGHPIDARSAFVASHALPRAHEIFSFAHLFHEMHRCCRAFGLHYRHARGRVA